MGHKSANKKALLPDDSQKNSEVNHHRKVDWPSDFFVTRNFERLKGWGGVRRAHTSIVVDEVPPYELVARSVSAMRYVMRWTVNLPDRLSTRRGSGGGEQTVDINFVTELVI